MSRVTFDDHLNDMMERLMNEDMNEDQLKIEIRRSRAIAKIVDLKIADKKVALDFVKAISNGAVNEKMIPSVFIDVFKKIGKTE